MEEVLEPVGNGGESVGTGGELVWRGAIGGAGAGATAFVPEMPELPVFSGVLTLGVSAPVVGGVITGSVPPIAGSVPPITCSEPVITRSVSVLAGFVPPLEPLIIGLTTFIRSRMSLRYALCPLAFSIFSIPTLLKFCLMRSSIKSMGKGFTSAGMTSLFASF